jgi:transposase
VAKKQVYSDVADEIIEIQIYGKIGQPKKGQVPERIEYKIIEYLFTPIERKASAIKQLGFFIIATNVLDESMPMEKMLNTYKEQQSVEKVFRFLKSPDFFDKLNIHRKTRADRSVVNGHDVLLDGIRVIRASDTQKTKRERPLRPRSKEKSRPKPNRSLGV